MSVHKPKPGVVYVAVRDLQVGQQFALSQSPRQLKVAVRIEDPDKKNQVRVWYKNSKDELRSTALFAGTKLIDRTGYKPKYKFVCRMMRGSINGLIPCYQFSDENSDATVHIPVLQFWR